MVKLLFKTLNYPSFQILKNKNVVKAFKEVRSIDSRPRIKRTVKGCGSLSVVDF